MKEPSSKSSEAGAEHVSPEEMADYLSGAETGRPREDVERHLAACDSCRGELMAAAEFHASSRARPWVVAAVPVLAAAVVAALLLVPRGGVPNLEPGSEPGAVLRDGGGEGVQPLMVVEPADGATVDADAIQFRWQSGGEDPFYQITVTSEAGDVVWTTSSRDTVVELPPEIPMEAGARYFWFVDGLLPGARTATSGVQEFTVRRQ